jgi:low temperature requirement protein LtrA
MTDSSPPNLMLARFKAVFWQPPRPHGEVIEDRTVSFLELFYDLVYVVLIARAAHTLADHPSWRGVFEFAAVFGLIWLAWVNGSSYQELHGREDGRSRSFIFLQMLILAVLAVYAGDAGGEGGAGFAVAYTAQLLVLTWLWYVVRRHDTDEWMPVTARYLTGMVVSIVAIGISIPLSEDARLFVWATVVFGWAVGGYFFMRNYQAFMRNREDVPLGVTATDSMIERFGLFTIIVLGEVVVGVVDGLSEVERTFRVMATGTVGLMIGFGFWWTYFDFVGRRAPREDRAGLAGWIYLHLPVTMAIAASGAAMVSLIEHAGDDRALPSASWLLTGSVALGLVTLALVTRTLGDYERVSSIYHPLTVALVAGAGASLLVGWMRPAPWVLVIVEVGILAGVWLTAVDRWFRLDDPESALPH